MKVKINIRGMSHNQAYPTNAQGRRYLSLKGKEYKKIIASHFKNAKIHRESGEFFHLTINFGFTDFFTKKGEVNSKRPDTSNGVKLIEDAISEAIGINDKYFTKHSPETLRQNFPEDFIEIYLEKI